MIEALLSPVHILSYGELSAQELKMIASFVSRKPDELTLAVVADNAPIPAKEELIGELGKIATVHRYKKVQPNPTTTDIMEMFGDPTFKDIDVIIGIGGGSTLDSAKALAMLATNRGEIEEYLGNKPKRTIIQASLPLILIPTTAGTGSEVTRVGVYTDSTGRKHTLGSPLMMARAAVLVASLLDSVPPSLCAATGLDALDHALESIWNKNATPQTRIIAQRAAIEILETLPRLYRAVQQNNWDKRELITKMLLASTKAGIAFNLTGTAAGHAISFVLSEEWNVPHGMACAFSLLELFDWAIADPTIHSELAVIGKHFHPESDAETAVSALRNDLHALLTEFEIPVDFPALGVVLDDPAVFDRAMDDPKLHNQLPPLSKEDLHALIGAKR
ncbi:MAG: iron-containing alcohol dehydrogenase [Spirochaetota bacterium]|nr:iron-containing alcohol dehydrogenase [Spirochaetota bacterium]